MAWLQTGLSRWGRVAFGAVIAATTFLACGAFIYQCVSVIAGVLVGVAWIILASACWIRAGTHAVTGTGAYAISVLVLLAWWAQIEPRNDRTWSPEMARNLSYRRAGDIITVSNVRDFVWTGPASAAEAWETRTYDLSTLKAVDIATLLWKGPSIGHTYFSFVWNDGQALSISVEIRKEKGEAYSAVGGFFKAYELAILAGDERDFYGWRVHFPGEDIQLYRTRATPQEAARFLTALLDAANRLDRKPQFYNTMTDNCTTEIWLFTSELGVGRPFDWRLVATGHLPEFLHDRGLLGSSVTFASLQARSHILPRARMALAAQASGASFSNAIREGIVPRPAGSP